MIKLLRTALAAALMLAPSLALAAVDPDAARLMHRAIMAQQVAVSTTGTLACTALDTAVMVTAGASTKTVALPGACSSSVSAPNIRAIGATVVVYKADAGAGDVVVTDGVTTLATLDSIGDFATFTRTASAWLLGPASGVTISGEAVDLINQTQLDAAIATRQPLDATLTALAGLTTAADKLIYATGADVFATASLTPYSRTLLAATDQAGALSVLGISPGPDNVALVANPTGAATGDTAKINAAIVAAGTGGTVKFPAGKTYLVGERCAGWPGSFAVLPALIDLNGSTIKINPTVVQGTTVASVTGKVSAGDTVIHMATGQAAAFCVGDNIAVRDSLYATKAYTYSTQITGISGDNLTVTAVRFASGSATSSSGGAVVDRIDVALDFHQIAGNLRLTNGTIDGNKTARSAQSLYWSYGDAVQLAALGSVKVDHIWFQHVAGNGLNMDDDSNSNVESVTMTDVSGMGVWPGGSGVQKDFLISDSQFSNVYQFTGSSTPTVDQYGHSYSWGAIASSDGSKRTIIDHVIVDGSTGYCVSTAGAPYDIEYVISNSHLSNCDAGGFRIVTGGRATITGVEVTHSGHETPYVSGQHELTEIVGSGAGEVELSGSYFHDAVLNVINDSGQINIGDTTFEDLGLSNVHHSTNTNIVAALYLSHASTGTSRMEISNITVRLPEGSVTDALDGVKINPSSHIHIIGGAIYGGWIGIEVNGAASDLSIRGMHLINQSQNDSGQATAVGIQINGVALRDCSIEGNHIILDTAGTYHWTGVQFGSSTYTGCSFSNNKIDVNGLTPSGGATGFVFSGSGAGLNAKNNQVTMNATSQTAWSTASATTAFVAVDNILLPAGVGVSYGSSSLSNFIGSSTVSGLPTCAAATKGSWATVTDLTTPTYGASLTGSGAVVRAATCDGSAWAVGR